MTLANATGRSSVDPVDRIGFLLMYVPQYILRAKLAHSSHLPGLEVFTAQTAGTDPWTRLRLCENFVRVGEGVAKITLN